METMADGRRKASAPGGIRLTSKLAAARRARSAGVRGNERTNKYATFPREAPAQADRPSAVEFRRKSILRRAARCAAIGIALLAWAAPPSGARANEFLLTGGGGEYSIRTATFADIPFKEVIRQRFDYSCGSAALATLLSYHYEHPVSEMTVLRRMYEQGDRQKIRKEGFSLLDMKRYLASIGLRADGFREPLDKLSRVGVPAIVLLNINGYLHFVVVKGVREDSVLTGDPTLGMQALPQDQFQRMWNGIIFVVTDRMQVARNYFNHARYWDFRPKAPRDAALQTRDHQLGTVALDLVRTPGYY